MQQVTLEDNKVKGVPYSFMKNNLWWGKKEESF